MTNNIHNKTRSPRAGFLFKIKWLFSFVWPVPLAKSPPGTNPIFLELYRGKILLNTTTANYSYGNLQTAFHHMFSEEQFNWSAIDSTLILGLGLGGVMDLMLAFNKRMRFVAIEADATIADWHGAYFNRANCEVIVESAEVYVQQSTSLFNCIVVDVYRDMDVPATIEDASFIRRLFDLLHPGGVVVFNKVVNSREHGDQFTELLTIFSRFSGEIKVNYQLGVNRFILANKTK